MRFTFIRKSGGKDSTIVGVLQGFYTSPYKNDKYRIYRRICKGKHPLKSVSQWVFFRQSILVDHLELFRY